MNPAYVLRLTSCHSNKKLPLTMAIILILGLVLLPGPSRAQKVRLRFMATTLPYNVVSTSTFEKTVTDEKGKTSSGGESITTIFQRQVTNPGEGVLVVRRKILSSENQYSVSRSVISPTGKPLVSSPTESKVSAPRITLQFPEKLLEKGDFWNYEIPPNEGFPAKTVIYGKVRSILSKDGSLVAVILMKSSSNALYKAKGFKGSIEYRSKIFFDVNNGFVVKMTSKTTLSTVSTKNPSGLPKTSLEIEVNSKLLNP